MIMSCYGALALLLSPTKEAHVRRTVQHLATLALAGTLAGMGLAPISAQAATYEELQQQVEDSTAAYEQAMDHVEKVQGQIDANEERIAQIEAELPAQRERAAGSLRTLYKLQQSSGGLIDVLLDSDDFNSFIATLTYLERIQSKNFSELEDLAALDAELREAKDTLKANKALADQELENARTAQQEALDAREAVRRQAEEQAAADRAAAEEAIRQAAAEAAAGKTITTNSGREVPVTAPDSSSPTPTFDDLKQNSDNSSGDKTNSNESKETKPSTPTTTETPSLESKENEFVSEWGPRIDSYLAGSTLSGYGNVFAQAAWEYGVDPRISPAISCIESGKGTVCFRPHNAWGWGQTGWSDWESAINGHVSGFARLYGYSLTTEGAQMYSGMSNWAEWYSLVLNEMNKI